MATVPPPLDELRRAVTSDCSPVRPLPPPARRVFAVAAWAPPAAFLCIAFLGLRSDAPALGGSLTWGVTVAEVALSLLLAAMALAAAIPGGGAPKEIALAALAAAALALAGGAWLTRAASPEWTVPNPWLSMGPTCLALTALIGLSVLALIAVLVFRAAPLRPARALLLGGAGAGLMAEGVYRLHCAVTDLRHVLLWHGGAVTTLALAAFGAAIFLERREGARMVARRTA